MKMGHFIYPLVPSLSDIGILFSSDLGHENPGDQNFFKIKNRGVTKIIK